jgi:hypothetical protein
MKRFVCLFTAGVLCLSLGAGQALAQAGGAAAGARKLVDEGKFAEALALTEPALRAEPSNPDIRMCQVDALLGLDRPVEARSLALSSVSMGPGFRYKAGVATANFGLPLPAIEIWKPLYADSGWAGLAYEGSVKGLLAIGKEAEAKALLAEALQKVSPPTVGLLKLSLTLDTAKASCLATLGRLKTVDPGNASKYDALANLYNASEGDLCQESFAGKLPVQIDLKEKSERTDTPTFNWGGSGNSGSLPAETPSNSGVRSGTSGYGSGSKDKAGNEGAKTANLVSSGRVLVQAGINGAKLEPMVIDSSVSTLMLAPKYAQKLNIQRLAPGEYDGVGLASPVASDWVLVKELKVGPLTFRNVPALLIDPKTEYWNDTAGIIPMWMFRHYALHYDRRHNKLTLLAPGTSPDEAMGAGSVQLRTLWYGAVPYAETRIQNNPACYMKVSTIIFGTYVEDRRAAALGVVARVNQGGFLKERGLYNIFSSTVADNVTLDLGTARINLPTVLVADLSPDSDVICSGTLGRNILDLFDMYFDYSTATLSLKGYEKWK